MALETVDPIDWSHPPPCTGQYPLSSTYCTVQCGLQITRLTALTEMRTCDLGNARPTHCLCGHSGCCEGKEGLATIPAFAAVELGQLLQESYYRVQEHIVLAPGALQYLLHAVANSERNSYIPLYIPFCIYIPGTLFK